MNIFFVEAGLEREKERKRNKLNIYGQTEEWQNIKFFRIILISKTKL